MKVPSYVHIIYILFLKYGATPESPLFEPEFRRRRVDDLLIFSLAYDLFNDYDAAVQTEKEVVNFINNYKIIPLWLYHNKGLSLVK